MKLLKASPLGRLVGPYHLIKALAQVKPEPKAAKQTKSPSLIFPASQASHSAIGTECSGGIAVFLNIIEYFIVG